MKKIFFLLLILPMFSCFQGDFLKNNSVYNVANNKGDLNPGVGETWVNAKETDLTTLTTFNWSCNGIADPVVIKQGNTFQLWYSGKNEYNIWNIGYATSEDGISWTQDTRNPIIKVYGANPNTDKDLDNTTDRLGVRVGSVLYDDINGVYRMWYRGIYKEYKTNILKCGIFQASSKDGIYWYKHPNISLNSFRAPTFIIAIKGKYEETLPVFSAMGSVAVNLQNEKLSSKIYPTYRFWYVDVKNDLSSDRVIKYVSSTTGVTISSLIKPTEIFTAAYKKNSLFANSYYMPTVINDKIDESNRGYKMWFVADMKIGLAKSGEEGKSYFYFNEQDKSQGLKFSAGELDADKDGFFSPFVLKDKDNNRYRMWYIGIKKITGGYSYRLCYKESLNF